MIILFTIIINFSQFSEASRELPILFPKDFWWGTSLSSYQSEGGNKNTWTEWEKLPGKIKKGEKSGQASDHWNRYKEDFELLKALNGDTHRFSIEWSRVEPEKGKWDESAFKHYRKMLQKLNSLQIRPVICLFHFTLPIWFSAQGGFENPNNIPEFINFVRKTQSELGDLVGTWLTLNEPVVYALGAYGAGLTPPGVKDLKRTLRVISNLLKAHGMAYQAIKSSNPKAQISFAHHLRVFEPKSAYSPLDWLGAKLADKIFNWVWYESLETGKIKINIPFVFEVDEDCRDCLNALDFIAFNYYGHDLIHFNPFSDEKFFLSTSKSLDKTDMGWDIFPEGITKILEQIKAHGLGKYSILITENGIADKVDKKRSDFIYQHLYRFLTESKKLGLNAKGYLYWSLIDNFEWIDGFDPRFGLIEVNYKNQERIPRPSAAYFQKLGQDRVLLKPTLTDSSSILHPESH